MEESQAMLLNYNFLGYKIMPAAAAAASAIWEINGSMEQSIRVDTTPRPSHSPIRYFYQTLDKLPTPLDYPLRARERNNIFQL